jgi:uncharacterized protein YfcZ (UPF0381/DUF406 family)
MTQRDKWQPALTLAAKVRVVVEKKDRAVRVEFIFDTTANAEGFCATIARQVKRGEIRLSLGEPDNVSGHKNGLPLTLRMQ